MAFLISSMILEMNKYKFQSIFQEFNWWGHYIMYPDISISRFLSYETEMAPCCDSAFVYDNIQGDIISITDMIQENIQKFEDEIEKTRKLLSEPCSGYLRHKLTDWHDYLREILKNDLEKYEKFKYDLLINFHYLV